MPAGTEELRHLLNVMRNTHLMFVLKFPGRTDIGDVTHDLFERRKEYLLGDFVHNLQAKDFSDQVIHRPSWQLVLSYEQAIRKQAFRYVISDNMTLAAFWEKAWKDPVTKERHFSTPLSLYAKRQPSVGEAPSGSTWHHLPKDSDAARVRRALERARTQRPSAATPQPRRASPYAFASISLRAAPFRLASSSTFAVTALTSITTLLDAPSGGLRQTPRGSTDLVLMVAQRFTAKHCMSSISFVGPRPNSLAAWLRKLAQRCGLPLKVEAIDIAVRPFVDLSNSRVQEQFLSRIKRGDFFGVVLTPPCSTFSRAPWRNKRGPRPTRSFEHPDGFPTLRWAERRKAKLSWTRSTQCPRPVQDSHCPHCPHCVAASAFH